MNYMKAFAVRIDLLRDGHKGVLTRLKSLEDKMDTIMAEWNARSIIDSMNILEDLGVPFNTNSAIFEFFKDDGRVKKLTWYIMHLSGITDPPFDEVGYPRRILELLLTSDYRKTHFWLGDVP